MAAIKAIEAQSVHKIQSGQVIVDLCSVVKELVENSLDAQATSIEVRFKNNGLDAIEVQDNGAGIDPTNYESIALKHYTSKLSSYDDLSQLHTFGFRGEALSSLCALSKFSIITAQEDEAPKGKRLEFETSGRFKSASTVACQKGTTAIVENLFEQLPVRQKELTKNIKREYGKVLGLLQAYACISVNVRFSVKNAMPKSRSTTVFSTNLNSTTKENIANVYGAKTLAALVPLELTLELGSTTNIMNGQNSHASEVQVRGHISKPVYGEGRQTPDRQMFFVNGRPCGLPQIAKAINEVYKSYNVSQSPFIFADFCMDTNAYDVNVSPDKRTILLHDSAALIEKLKNSLIEMFDKQDQTVPHSQVQTSNVSTNLTTHRQLAPSQSNLRDIPLAELERAVQSDEDSDSNKDSESEEKYRPQMFLQEHFRNQTVQRKDLGGNLETLESKRHRDNRTLARTVVESMREDCDDVATTRQNETGEDSEASLSVGRMADPTEHANLKVKNQLHDLEIRNVVSDRSRDLEDGGSHTAPPDSSSRVLRHHSTQEEAGVVQNVFERMRPWRISAELATLAVEDENVTKVIGTQSPREHDLTQSQENERSNKKLKIESTKNPPSTKFSQGLRKFEAFGAGDDDDDERNEDVEASEDSRSTNSEVDGEVSQHANDNPTSINSESQTIDHGSLPSDNEDIANENQSDSDYQDEAFRRNEERARVQELIRAAEESIAEPSKANLVRANKALAGGQHKHLTTDLLTKIEVSLNDIQQLTNRLGVLSGSEHDVNISPDDLETLQDKNDEEKLSLTVSKTDFGAMHVIGQFNLGFILAVRSGEAATRGNMRPTNSDDELFIIDQHASDEKFNFERLQAETIVGNQRLVQPAILDLTAVEEEIILENLVAMEKNGFLVEVDPSGQFPVGRRCKLISLPLSREVIFDSNDLDELIHLLSETPSLGPDSAVPRPTKVRKMFAMRACRSSIMIGKTLSQKQMLKVVRQMGLIDKPWNCPHGRPTMRHLASLKSLSLWHEGDGTAMIGRNSENTGQIWHQYVSS